MCYQKKNFAGFTLIELLIVIAIIAILALIAVPNFLEAQTRAKTARAMADMKSVATAIFMLQQDTGYLPVDYWDDDHVEGQIRCRDIFKTNPNVHNNQGGTTGILVPLSTPIPYMSSIPMDPFATAGMAYPDLIREDWPTPCTYVYVDEDPGIPGGDNGSQIPLMEGDYILCSAGPDKQWVQGRAILYDPTNGTVSGGDIIYNNRTQFAPYNNKAIMY